MRFATVSRPIKCQRQRRARCEKQIRRTPGINKMWVVRKKARDFWCGTKANYGRQCEKVTTITYDLCCLQRSNTTF